MSRTHNRRWFLAAAMETIAGVTLTGWSSALLADSGHGVAGIGDSTLIDAHTHFYDPSRPQGVPWPPRDDKLLYRSVVPKHYRALPVPRTVTGTVVVEASPWLEDNQWVLDLRIIIDHLAGVTVNGKAPPADWVREMRALARRPKIYCKLSGLVEGTGRSDGSAPRDVEFYRPVLDALGEMFGVDRLIYASNWPVSERFGPLATVQGIIEDYFRSHGRRAEEGVFSQSAKGAYQWVRRL